MATSNETKPKKNISTKAQNTSKATPSKTSETRQPLAAFTFVLAVVAIVIAVYAAYNSVQNDKRLSKQAERITVSLTELSQIQADIKEKISSSLLTVRNKQSQLDEKLHAIDKNTRSALNEKLYHSNDWLLLKARYYLQLAQINAHWSNNQQATLSLLNKANELLATLPDQRLFKIRQAIAQELTQIKSLPQVDMAGLLSQLDAAQSAIVNLPLNKPTIPNNAQPNQDTAQDTPSAWRERLKNSVNLLERLVVIRRHNESIKPLLTDEQESILRQSIHLNIQEAQWAVLQQNETIYKMALGQAINSIENHFKVDATQTQALLTQLNKLKDISIKQQKPKLTDSLQLLNKLIESGNPPSLEPATNGDDS